MNREILNVNDDIQIRTIQEICNLFEAPLKKRGFLYPGATIHPTKSNVIIWWPAIENRQGWKNIVNIEYNEIIETHEDELKHKEHVKNILKHPKEIRYVFLYDKHGKGRKTYKFIGEFQLNMDKTNSQIGLVWKRISKQIAIK